MFIFFFDSAFIVVVPLCAFLLRCRQAHGTWVGLPSDDDMGNSEVGHNAIGSGKVYVRSLLSLSLQARLFFDE